VNSRELHFDVSVYVEIHIKVDDEKKDELINLNVNRLRSLFLCFDVELPDNGIALSKGRNKDLILPQLKSYLLSTLLCFDSLNYQEMHIINRTFTEIISLWNQRYSGYTLDFVSLELKSYEAS
jgi:hypothetical protein